MKSRAIAACAALMLAAGCGGQDAAPSYSAEIIRTAYGVPHIVAPDHAGLGYGLGYAAAEDNICMIAEQTVTLRGERARWFGPGAGDANIASDLYHRRILALGEIEARLNGPAGDLDTPSAAARGFVAGFAAGVSRYLADTGVENINDARCAGAEWVRPLSAEDVWLGALTPPYGNPIADVAGAQPPAAPAPQNDASLILDRVRAPMGSNAYGLGREATRGGRGVLLGNPHYPWHGPLRFYRSHLVIPGELNVAGAGLVGTPFPGIGHNDRIAWSHTVSTARRFGYFELTLDPDDPTRYRAGDEYRAMTAREITVPVLGEDGEITEVTRTLYDTEFGPVAVSRQMPWTEERAFAMAIPGEGLRVIDQYLAIWGAQDVRDLHAALSRYQSTGFNTISADADGGAYHGDMGMVPNVTDELARACAASPLAMHYWTNFRVPVLDAANPDCRWGTDADSTREGVFGPSNAPHIFRDDWVAQSNDSHWLSSTHQPMEGYSPVYGDERTPRSLRTRLAIDQIERRLAGTDGLGAPGFDLETLQTVMFSNRHHGGELGRDALAGLCREQGGEDLQPACAALENWDLRVDADSRGAILFSLFIHAGGMQFADAFDADNPARTPAVLDVTNPAVLEALRTAVGQLAEAGLPPDARVGDVQAEMRGNERIEIHGGPGGTGVFNMINPVFPQNPDNPRIQHGSSWIMTVEFTDDGPRSGGILSYSQSTNPASPHFGDQTRLYAEKGWDDLLFDPEAARAAAVSVTRIEE